MTRAVLAAFGPVLSQVFGMDPSEPFLRAVSDLALVIVQHGFPPRGIMDLVFLEIPVPQPIIRTSGCQRIALFTLTQSLFGLLSRQLRLNASEHHRKINRFAHKIVGSKT